VQFKGLVLKLTTTLDATKLTVIQLVLEQNVEFGQRVLDSAVGTVLGETLRNTVRAVQLITRATRYRLLHNAEAD
jgi:hypothetical protein